MNVLAILKLAKTYNDSDSTLKKKVELEYIDKHSILFEWTVFVKAIRAYLASKGNIKARYQKYKGHAGISS